MVELYQDYEKTNSDPPHLPSALNNLPGYFCNHSPSQRLTALIVSLRDIFPCGTLTARTNREAGSPLHGLPEVIMEKNKQRAIGILIVLGSILVLVATWDIAENQARTNGVS
jgi:hypothetical protein